MTDKNGVLIIGSGFIGSALAVRLRDSGVVVHILSREAVIPHYHYDYLYTGGLSNIDAINKILPEVNTIIHAASATTPGVSSRTPSIEAESNIEPTLRFLDTLQDHTDKHLVYLSSGGTVYGNTIGGPVTEDTEICPLSYYGAGKVAIETFLGAYSNTCKADVTVLRPSNIYGPGQPYYQGFGVIRTIFKHIKDGTTMEIWGNGEAVRDYLYIDDLVNACIEVLNRRPKLLNVFNIGSGAGFSINSLIEKTEQASGRNLEKVYRPTRSTDVSAIILNHDKLTKATGWIPETSIEDGLIKTWEWILENDR